jgi:uncharacterized protein
MRDLLEALARELVSRPDEVSVRELDSRDGVRLELRVAPDDIGRVVGRGGRTARALRTVMGALGGRGVRVDLVDVDRAR